MRTIVAMVIGLLAASCGPSGREAEPGAVTADEARALEEAAEMLQARRMPPGAFDERSGAEPERPKPGEGETKPDA